MMQPVVFKVQLFAGPGDLERSEEALLWMLEALCKVNEGELKRKPYPPLYESGVHYERENGTENWLDIPHIIEAGWGDCEDLACWRVAELRMKGETVGPYIRFRRVNGVYHFHALVLHYEPIKHSKAGPPLLRRESGKRFRPVAVEDPSLRLGMGWEAEYARLHGRGKASS